MDFQTVAAILFILLMLIFVFRNRSKVYTQKIAYPFLYFIMYKTKLGLGFMDRFAKKFPRILKWAAYAGIFIGFLGMIFISFSLVHNLMRMLITPSATPGVALVLPFKVKGSFYVPFFYWIISIFVLAVVHEFSHGIMSRVYDVKIKSSGFAFLGIIVPILPAAFVEPDEKELKKKGTAAKLSIYAAGPFSNILFAALVALMFSLLFMPLAGAIFQPSGIEVEGYIRQADNTTFPAEAANISRGEVITHINNLDVSSIENFTKVLGNTTPGQEISIKTNVSSYNIKLAEDPQHVNKSYLGVYVKQNTEIRKGFTEKYGNILTSSLIWIIGLFYWLYVLNLGIGLFNLVPLGPIDGGRMLYTVLVKYIREDLAVKIWKFIGMCFMFIILISILFAFIK